MRMTTGLAAALLMLVTAAASAQDIVPAPEVGVGYGGLLVKEKGGDYTVGPSRPAIHLRLTLPFTPRFSFEGLTTISSRTSAPAFHVIDGLYLLQVKQRLRSATDERFHAFLTYGAAGYYARFHQKAITVTHANGIKEEIGEAAFHQTDAPFFALVGGGFQRELGRRAALRIDAQMVTLLWFPSAARFSAGISLPLGDYDASRASRTR